MADAVTDRVVVAHAADWLGPKMVGACRGAGLARVDVAGVPHRLVPWSAVRARLRVRARRPRPR
ncbi:hypothetical protein D0Q02_08740 [Micromonospora craniellae]|uniref:Uncharacterized protein n=1 Tax=Micromonospora craniellae TaxID=2294034 RepID=A0A372G1P0_9ACTN|nr:hypothetical protein D0Q02_08740 [Micromonospora craniellae]